MADGPVSDQVLAALRSTAALVRAVPCVRLRICHGSAVVLEVRAPVGTDPEQWVLPPCGYHRAVARAHHLRRAGERVALRGVPSGCHPSIHVGLPAGGKAMPGAMVRLAQGGRWWHLAPIPLGGAVTRRALEEAPAELDPVALHVDHEVEATILHVTSDPGDHRASARAVHLLGTAVALAGIEDLATRLDATVPDVLPGPAGPSCLDQPAGRLR